MNELRWILLAAGLLLIAGIYAWGLRARSRAATRDHERTTRVEPARSVPVVAAPPRPEPHDDTADDDALDEPQEASLDADTLDEPPTLRLPTANPRRDARIEPRIEPRIDTSIEPVATPARTEPRLEPGPSAAREPAAQAQATPAESRPRKPQSQKIVAVRVVAASGAHFAGETLLDALRADGFTFGRYQIFHRLDEEGRPLVSLASLKEPGTFDPETMPGAQFRGVALFAVMPGPLPGMRAFDELIVTARALAATLDGQLQDERGGPLSVQRIGHLRDDVAEFERARGAAPDA